MIIKCYFVVKSAIKQESSIEAATSLEEFRYISILAVRDRCCLSITSCAVCCTEFLIRVDKGNTRIKILSSSCGVDYKLKGTAACGSGHQAFP
jgi:hypothetical protein